MMVKKASIRECLACFKKNEVLHSDGPNFQVLRYEGFVYGINLYERNHKFKVAEETYNLDSSFYNLCLLIPPVLSFHLHYISSKRDQSVPTFWQYPCATEKQACENHFKLDVAQNIDAKGKKVNIYVGLPWATFIDLEKIPQSVIKRVQTVISLYKKICAANGYNLRVHTVCQHIYWYSLLDEMALLGITNLHISHKEISSDEAFSSTDNSITLQAWPLIAVNYVTPELSDGLEFRPLSQRKLLASFIGSHMSHYRDDSRLRLANLKYEKSLNNNVVVHLNNEWHFNEYVYEEQVQGLARSAFSVNSHKARTKKYNDVLSNSRYALCPQGAGPNTLRLWEAMAIGTVPVLFSSELAIFYESPLGRELYNLVEFRDLDDNLFDNLAAIPVCETRTERLRNVYKKFENLTCF